MIERFNGRIAEVLATTRFDSAEHLADTIKRYVKVYNQHIPQKALGHSPPLQAMKNWSQKQPQKCVYNLAGLDARTDPISKRRTCVTNADRMGYPLRLWTRADTESSVVWMQGRARLVMGSQITYGPCQRGISKATFRRRPPNHPGPQRRVRSGCRQKALGVLKVSAVRHPTMGKVVIVEATRGDGIIVEAEG